MSWPCFWVEPLDLETRTLRQVAPRWTANQPADTCPVHGRYHCATLQIEDGPVRWAPHEEGDRIYHTASAEGFEDHPGWQQIAACACGYRFTGQDRRLVDGEIYYEWCGDHRRWPMDQLPIGAMLDSRWTHRPGWLGPDGLSVMVKLPPGSRYDWWHIDGPATGGGHWARSGRLPLISVTPSIATPGYHGFLGSNGTPPGTLSDPL